MKRKENKKKLIKHYSSAEINNYSMHSAARYGIAGQQFEYSNSHYAMSLRVLNSTFNLFVASKIFSNDNDYVEMTFSPLRRCT